MSLVARSRLRLPRPTILWTISVAWGLAVVAEVSGHGAALHHDALIEGGLPFAAALGLFLVAWQVMIAAMMLPSTLPVIKLFNHMAGGQPEAARERAAFVAGYVAVWSAFGALAFTGDLGVHRTADTWPWLAGHSWLIAGGTFVLAGAFQFSSLKQRCLLECCHPAAFLLRHYRRGSGAALRTGVRYGLSCLGSCWALMFVAFAAGVANLAWMAIFTLIMIFEKTSPAGNRAAGPVGVGLSALGVLIIIHPVWLPPVFATV